MKYILIKNKGEIDSRSFTLLGASSKRNDETKIGQFGSGNKYAIAFLMRNKKEFHVFSGLREIEFSTEKETFRNEIEFDVIKIDGEKTSITTELGLKWTFWMSFREIYSNALDEGLIDISYVNSINPVEGETHFYIFADDEAKQIINSFDHYFATNKEILFENSTGRILKKTGKQANIYRKGIRCVQSEIGESIYDYDFNEITINESRLVEYSWQIQEKIWKLICACDKKEVIEFFFSNLELDVIESEIESYVTTDWVKSETYKQVVSCLKMAPHSLSGLITPDERGIITVVPDKIYKQEIVNLNKHENSASMFHHIDGTFLREFGNFSEKEWFMLVELENKLKECRADYFMKKYEIKKAIFSNPETLGAARDNTIFLCEKSFELGLNLLLQVVIEEYTHLESGKKDKTRAFQDALIQQFVNYLQSSNALIF